MKPGFRIKPTFRRSPAEHWQSLKSFTTPDISDALQGLYTLSPSIRNQVNTQALIGPAVTVKLAPGDNLMLHSALDQIQAGDVVVVQALSVATAICGELLAHKLHHAGALGLITNGYIRDLTGIQELGLPIYAQGTTAIGPHKQGPGELHVPISCGEQVIHPGDLMVADELGIIVVPQDDIEWLSAYLQAQQAEQEHYHQQVIAGQFSNDWVQERLQQLGIDQS